MSRSFNLFLKKFPKLKLPLTLSEEDALHYSRENEPLPHKLIGEYIQPIEGDFDDLTEYVPCFQVADLKNFYAVVYWKAGLMNYQYVMVTFEEAGKVIDRRVLAGTVSDGKVIVKSVARLDDDMSIYIMSGPTVDTEGLYEAARSTTLELELMPNGKVVELE